MTAFKGKPAFTAGLPPEKEVKGLDTGNWILDNLYSALQFWNTKLAEIWMLITQSPQSFKGGGIWKVVTGINGSLKAIGYALLVLFFLVGVVKPAARLQRLKGPNTR